MFTFTFNVFLLQREIEREREREREKWWSLSRWEICSQIRKKGKVASCQFTSPCTFIRGNILHIWCVVVTNLSVCLFVCQQVACDVVTVFSIGVAVPCQSQSVESVNRLVDQSISHDSLVSLLISHSVSVSVPVHTPARPFAPLARSGFPPLLPWTYYVYYAYVYYHTHTHTHTRCFLLLFSSPSSPLYTTVLEEKSREQQPPILERIHPLYACTVSTYGGRHAWSVTRRLTLVRGIQVTTARWLSIVARHMWLVIWYT